MTPEQFAQILVSGPTPFQEHGRDYDGLDCWGLVWLGYREIMGVELPSYVDQYDTTRPNGQLSRLITGERDLSWVQVTDELRPMDVALFRYGSVPLHVGLLISGRVPAMVHIENGADVALENPLGPMWRPRSLGFWRPR